VVIKFINPDMVNGLDTMTFPAYRSLLYQSEHPHVCIVGGYLQNNIATLLIATKVDASTWEILSLFTCKAYRAQGYAKEVVVFFCTHLRNNGVQTCMVKYMTHKENTPTLDCLCDALGFEPSKPRQFMIRGVLSQMQKAPWTRLFRNGLPKGFSIKFWADVTHEERKALYYASVHETWIPKDLNPFDFEENYAKALSLALVFEGEVVGWSITHVLDAQTLRFTNVYIKASLQLRGQFIALVNRTMDIMAQEGLLYGSWAVCVSYPKTIAFYQKHLIPYCNWTGYSVLRSIALTTLKTPS